MGTGATLTSAPVNAQPPRLLDQVRSAARQHGYTEAVASTIADWCASFIRFHGKRHPRELDTGAAGPFLESVAQTAKDPVRRLAASRAALEFLYQQVLHIDPGELSLPRPPRLLDQVRQVLRVRHYALRTEECYVQWIVRFIRFHNQRHPRDMGAAEVAQFLSILTRCSGPWPGQGAQPARIRPSIATPFGTALRPIWWSAGSTYGPFRYCLAMKVWKRRGSTPTWRARELLGLPVRSTCSTT